MDFFKNNPVMVVVGLGAGLILLAVILIFGQIRTNEKTADEKALDLSTITSQFTKTTEGISINYGGDADPYRDGVLPNIAVFGLDELQMPEVTRSSLRGAITKALSPEIRATNDATYAQIDQSTINCADKYDCSFKFYLDSPEGYYSFRLFRNTGGGVETTLVREPLPGGDND